MRWRDVKQGKSQPLPKKEKLEVSSIPPIASLLDRFKAFVTDSFMILMPLLYFVFYVIMGSREAFAQNMLAGWMYILIPHFIITLLFWKFKGQTPGYKQYNIILLDTKGNPPSLVQLILRYVFFGLSIPLIAGVFIGFIRDDKKNMHDIFSHTFPAQKNS